MTRLLTTGSHSGPADQNPMLNLGRRSKASPPPTPRKEDPAAALAGALDAIRAAAVAEEGREEWESQNPDTTTRNPADARREGAAIAMRRAQRLDPEALSKIVATVTLATPASELRAMVTALADVDTVALGRARDVWAKAGIMKLGTSSAMVKDADRRRVKIEAQANTPRATQFSPRDVVMTPHGKLVKHATACLTEANRQNPTIFWQGDRLVCVRPDSEGTARIVPVDGPLGLGAILNRWVLFTRQRGKGKDAVMVQVACPADVARDVWHHPDPASFALPLEGLRTAPFFDSTGALVATDGYHHGSKTVVAMKPELREAMARIAAPGWKPTAEEARAAARFIIEEVLADFPLDKRQRAETMRRFDKGQPIPSVAAALALFVQPFCRDLITGPCPAAAWTKPQPGTGASLAVEAFSITATGDDASPLTFPRDKEEVGKTLASLLREGATIGFFDNVGTTVNAEEFASVLTARRLRARILGTTATLDVPVKATWVLTGNSLAMSGELCRRVFPITLDAGIAAPTTRGGWRHADLLEWVRQHRGELVVSILTLIQRYLDLDRPEPTCPQLASFERWRAVCGGIIEHAAGIKDSFLVNLESFKAKAVQDSDDGVSRLMARLADYPVGTVFRSGVSAKGASPLKNAATGDPETGRVVSLLEVLNEAANPTDGTDPLLIDGWGYERDRDTGVHTYTKVPLLTRRFSAAAERPWAVRDAEGQDVLLHIEERRDARGGARGLTYWVRVPERGAEAEEG